VLGIFISLPWPVEGAAQTQQSINPANRADKPACAGFSFSESMLFHLFA
jgi:hypothetical protein